MMTVPTILEKTYFRKVFNIVLYGTIIFLAFLLYRTIVQHIDNRNQVRQEVICPALLSIGRSARDTLIIMKAEPLCNGFVLDNLR